MNSNFENIPSVIFDWIKTLSYGELNKAQKEKVLTYFSEETYQELHLAGKKAKHVYHASAVPEDFQSRKILLEHFDKHQQLRNLTGTSSKSLLFWQAAAILLMMLSGGLFYSFIDLKKAMGSQTVAAVDTVYVTKEIAGDPSIIYDTVYLYKQIVKTSVVNKHEAPGFEESIFSPLIDGQEQRSIDLQDIDTKSRGGSMKDDSLLKKFRYVSM